MANHPEPMIGLMHMSVFHAKLAIILLDEGTYTIQCTEGREL